MLFIVPNTRQSYAHRHHQLALAPFQHSYYYYGLLLLFCFLFNIVDYSVNNYCLLIVNAITMFKRAKQSLTPIAFTNWLWRHSSVVIITMGYYSYYHLLIIIQLIVISCQVFMLLLFSNAQTKPHAHRLHQLALAPPSVVQTIIISIRIISINIIIILMIFIITQDFQCY